MNHRYIENVIHTIDGCQSYVFCLMLTHRTEDSQTTRWHFALYIGVLRLKTGDRPLSLHLVFVVTI